MNRILTIIMTFGSLSALIVVGLLSHDVRPIEAYLILGITATIRAFFRARIASVSSIKFDPIFPCGMFLVTATGLGMGTGSEYWDVISRNAAWSLFGLFSGFVMIHDYKLLEKRSGTLSSAP